MKNIKWIAAGGTFLLIITVFLVFFGWPFRNRSHQVWQLIPGTAVFVLETSDVSAKWQEFQSEPALHQVAQLFEKKDMPTLSAGFGKLSGDEWNWAELLEGEKGWISWHVTSRTGFDPLYFLPLQSESKKLQFNSLLQKVRGQQGVKTQTREYLDFKITEIRLPDSEQMFSYLLYDDFLIGSFRPFLVEDVIRMLKDERLPTFQQANPPIFSNRLNQSQETVLYLNFRAVTEWLEVFSKDKAHFTRLMGQLGRSAKLETDYKNNYLMLNGFSFAEDSLHYLSVFEGQKGKGIHLAGYVPNRTALLFHTSFQNPLQWQLNLQAFWAKSEPDILKKRLEIAGNGFDFKRFFSYSGNEAAWAVLESVDPRAPEQLFLLQLTDAKEMKDYLDAYIKEAVQTHEFIRYSEEYNGYQIGQLPVNAFPSLLMGEIFSGFDESFYLLTDQHLVVANDVMVLKSYLNDQASENTWGRSLDKNKFLENVVQDANLSFFVQTDRAWEILKAHTHPEWEKFMQKEAYLLKGFHSLAFQFSQIDGRYYTSCSIEQKGGESRHRHAPKYTDFQQVYADAPLVNRPFVVRNHEDNSKEVIVQDTSNYLYLIANDGLTLWKKQLPGKVISDVIQVDFYDNGKLQYFMATSKALHIIDRKGNYLPGYPMAMPEHVTVEFANVIDYDGSKRYRFLVSDKETGDLYLFDKGGVSLKGWRPRKMTASLTSAPFHFRVRGKDCIVAVGEDGKVWVLNRRSEAFKGFPLQLKSRLENPLFVDRETSVEKTTITTLTPGGLLVSFNLKGEITNSKQLYRPTAESTFKMSLDGLGRSFIIARQQMNNLSVLNYEGDLLFEKDFVTPENIAVQFYDFGSGNEVFAITDPEQEFTYLYNRKGELINQLPVESGFEVGLMYYEHLNRFYLYHNFNSLFSIKAFSM